MVQARLWKKTSSHCPMVASVAHGNHQWVTRHACSGEPRPTAEQREAGQARRVRQVATKRLHEDSRASNVRVKMTSDTIGRREKEVHQTSSNVCAGSLGIPGKLTHSTPAHAVALARSVLSCLRRKLDAPARRDRPHTAASKTRRTTFVMALFCPSCGPPQPKNGQTFRQSISQACCSIRP